MAIWLNSDEYKDFDGFSDRHELAQLCALSTEYLCPACGEELYEAWFLGGDRRVEDAPARLEERRAARAGTALFCPICGAELSRGEPFRHESACFDLLASFGLTPPGLDYEPVDDPIGLGELLAELETGLVLPSLERMRFMRRATETAAARGVLAALREGPREKPPEDERERTCREIQEQLSEVFERMAKEAWEASGRVSDEEKAEKAVPACAGPGEALICAESAVCALSERIVAQLCECNYLKRIARWRRCKPVCRAADALRERKEQLEDARSLVPGDELDLSDYTPEEQERLADTTLRYEKTRLQLIDMLEEKLRAAEEALAKAERDRDDPAKSIPEIQWERYEREIDETGEKLREALALRARLLAAGKIRGRELGAAGLFARFRRVDEEKLRALEEALGRCLDAAREERSAETRREAEDRLEKLCAKHPRLGERLRQLECELRTLTELTKQSDELSELQDSESVKRARSRFEGRCNGELARLREFFGE